MARPYPTLIVDFDGAFVGRTCRAIRTVGGQPAVWMFEDLTAQHLETVKPVAIVLAASNLGVSYKLDPDLLSVDVPFLGICNGAQLIAEALGGKVEPLVGREEGRVDLLRSGGLLLAGTPKRQGVLMYHEYVITALPPRLRPTSRTALSPVASFEGFGRPPLFGVQFHPESPETQYGVVVLRRFLLHAAGYAFLSRVRRAAARGLSS